jgi:hypothetical protein
MAKEYSTKAPPWGYASHPLVDGDQLLVPVGGEGSGVVSLDKQTGEERWRAVTATDIAYAPLVIYEPESAPGERQLFFWHSEGVTSLDPSSGKVYWEVKFPEEPNPSNTQIATPRMVGDLLFISEYYKGSLLLKVKSSPPGVEELWRSEETDPRNRTSLNSMMTTPVIREGLVYGISYDPRGNGIFRCIRLETGEMVWTEEQWLGEEPVMFASAFIVENEGRYLIFNDLGELMFVELTPEGFREVDRAEIVKPTGVARGRHVVWSHPAFSQGRMVARNDEEIVCIDLRQHSEGAPAAAGNDGE